MASPAGTSVRRPAPTSSESLPRPATAHRGAPLDLSTTAQALLPGESRSRGGRLTGRRLAASSSQSGASDLGDRTPRLEGFNIFSHRVGRAVGPISADPFPAVQPSTHRDLLPLREVRGVGIGVFAEGGYIHLGGPALLPAAPGIVDSDPRLLERAGAGVLQLGVAGEATDHLEVIHQLPSSLASGPRVRLDSDMASRSGISRRDRGQSEPNHASAQPSSATVSIARRWDGPVRWRERGLRIPGRGRELARFPLMSATSQERRRSDRRLRGRRDIIATELQGPTADAVARGVSAAANGVRGGGERARYMPPFQRGLPESGCSSQQPRPVVGAASHAACRRTGLTLRTVQPASVGAPPSTLHVKGENQ
jgi:hypothetical protein